MKVQNYVYTHPVYGTLRVLKTTYIRFVLFDICNMLGLMNATSRFAAKMLKADVRYEKHANISKSRLLTSNYRGVRAALTQMHSDRASEILAWIDNTVMPDLEGRPAIVPEDKTVEIYIPKIGTDLIGQMNEMMDRLTAKIKEDEKYVAFAKEITLSEGCVNTRHIAGEWGLSAQKFNEILRKLHIIYPNGRSWNLYEKYRNCHYIEQTIKCTPSGRAIPIYYWTMEGYKFVNEVLHKAGYRTKKEIAALEALKSKEVEVAS